MGIFREYFFPGLFFSTSGVKSPGGGWGGGGTSILTVTGTRYDFAVITIDTGYLNRPNWLLADDYVYHRVASQPTMFMTGPRSRHQRWCVRDHNMIHSRIDSPSVPRYQYRICIWKFLVRYIVTGCIFCAPSGLRQGQVFTPPSKWESSAPLPPPPPPPSKWEPSAPRGNRPESCVFFHSWLRTKSALMLSNNAPLRNRSALSP